MNFRLIPILIASCFSGFLYADSGANDRFAEIRHIEHLQGHRLRAFVSVFESSGDDGIRYPITTLDRGAFQFFTAEEPDQPLQTESLSTFSTLSPPRPRATVISFPDSDALGRKLAAEVRKSVAETLPSFRSDFLAVLASGGGQVVELAAMDPVQSENIKALQRKVNSSQSLGSEGGSALALCGARDRFKAWQDLGVEAVDQKTVVLIGPDGDPLPVARDLYQRCWLDLRTMGVRVFHVSYTIEGENLGKIDLSSIDDSDAKSKAAMSGGGMRYKVQGALDVFPALSNIASNLNDEYVVEFELSQKSTLSPQVGLLTRISYHGDVFASLQRTAQIPMSVVVSSLPEQKEEDVSLNERPKTWWIDVVLILTVGGAMILLYLVLRSRWRLYSQTLVCNSCGVRVMKDYSNCPFRRTDCIAKLTVLNGPHLGRQYPLFAGRNSLGRGSKNTIQIAGFSGIKRRHAVIEIKEGKAVYSTMNKSDRINGWSLNEPRLIGGGTVISMNGLNLHFEAKGL